MNRTHITFLSMGIVATALAVLAPAASAQDDDFPPPEVIATLTPTYFEGHAAYWYHDHWHYRDARGAWGFYHDEPAFLRDRRVARPVDRHYYTTGHSVPFHGGGGRR
jgi:hypothetical protein